jgi:hypothetical protein
MPARRRSSRQPASPRKHDRVYPGQCFGDATRSEHNGGTRACSRAADAGARGERGSRRWAGPMTSPAQEPADAPEPAPVLVGWTAAPRRNAPRTFLAALRGLPSPRRLRRFRPDRRLSLPSCVPDCGTSQRSILPLNSGRRRSTRLTRWFVRRLPTRCPAIRRSRSSTAWWLRLSGSALSGRIWSSSCSMRLSSATSTI